MVQSANQRLENHLIENREIRIFLSSTFSDMDAERSALVKLFQKLKMEANRRNVALSLLDLRWGITDEESRTGKVLSVCLNEIENSHPFFIGLLGRRYGSTPDASELKKNPELKERYPWIEKYISDGMSITEIEMQYGVLRNQQEMDAAFFIKSEVSSNPDDNSKLTHLKNELYTQHRYPVYNYTSIDDLCNLVEQEVVSIILKYFKDADGTLLERDRGAQKAYMNSRHSFYVKRKEDFDRIDKFVYGDESHLVISGPSGIGKSALIANWLKENKQRIPFNTIYYFVSNSFTQNDYTNILQYICDEIYALYGIEKRNNPSETLEEETQRIVIEAKSKGRPLLIVIDGINQISDNDNGKLLNWLPSAPSFVKYLFSSLNEDETMNTFVRHQYPIYTICPLNRESRKAFIEDYLANVGKKLTDDQIDRILNKPINENMLVLRTLLDELICFGSHEMLNDRIDYYLSAKDIRTFFDNVLQRMEADYSTNQDVVRTTLSLVALSEQGLSEEEILTITGIRPFDWHLFYCAFCSNFVARNGLLYFSHSYVGEAVYSRYMLNNKEISAGFRHKIIKAFEASQSMEPQRKIYELAFQYFNTENHEQLHQVLLSFSSFSYFYRTDYYKKTLALYWSSLLSDNANEYQLEDYLKLPVDATRMEEYPLLEIGLFSQVYFAAYNMSLKCYQLYYHYVKDKEGTNNPNTTSALVNIGFVFKEYGDFSKALDFYLQALENAEKNIGVEHSYTAALYSNIGNIFTGLNKFEEALSYQFKALEIEEKLLGMEHPETAATYNNIGGIFFKIGAYKQSLDFHLKALKIYEDNIGIEHPQTLIVMNNVGTAYSYIDIDKALQIHNTILSIRERLLGTQHPDVAFTYNNIGGVYKEKGDWKNALLFYKKALPLLERVFEKGHPILGTLYSNIGQVYGLLGDKTEAINYYRHAILVLENTLGSTHQQTVKLYNIIANILVQQGEDKVALEYLRKILDVFNKILGTNHPNTIKVKEDIASIETIFSSPKEVPVSNPTIVKEEKEAKKSFWKKLFGKKP